MVLNITTPQEAFAKIRYVFIVFPNHILRWLHYLRSSTAKILRDK